MRLRLGLRLGLSRVERRYLNVTSKKSGRVARLPRNMPMYTRGAPLAGTGGYVARSWVVVSQLSSACASCASRASRQTSACSSATQPTTASLQSLTKVSRMVMILEATAAGSTSFPTRSPRMSSKNRSAAPGDELWSPNASA